MTITEVGGVDKTLLEKQRRDLLWTRICSSSAEGVVEPRALTDLEIYGGGRGIWTNKSVTSVLDEQSGVTVSVLHTGRHYPDDLSEKYLVYHYPRTGQEGKDNQEIRATKSACQLRLPIFVISTAESNPRLRAVKRGYVTSWDDSARTFFVQFDDGNLPPPIEDEPNEDAPFSLKGEAETSYSKTKTRPNQPKFNFEVLKRYGASCAVCDIAIPELLQAAHICGKGEDGSDDPRNGIVLCANHHRAYDEYLFSIEPSSLTIVTKKGGPNHSQLVLNRTTINHLAKKPHHQALEWHYSRFVRG